jgi:hypothetical protein
LCETTALAQYPAVFHRTEQRVIETLHRIAATRGRGMKRVGSMLKPSPAAKATALHIGVFGRIILASAISASSAVNPRGCPLGLPASDSFSQSQTGAASSLRRWVSW